MNNDLNTDRTVEESERTEAPARRPIRRARRTVAPFVKETVSEPAEEITSENAEESETLSEPAAASSDPAEVSSITVEEETESSAPFDESVAENEAEAEETADASSEIREEASAKEREGAQEDEKKLSPLAETFDWIKSFLLSLTAVIFIFTLLFRGVTVNGGSMLPTLETGEYLIISDLLYTPKNGDVVVVQSPHYKNGTEPLIKRVIAIGGQTVKINFNTWEIYVDGELLHEDYILRDGSTAMNCEDMKPDENGEVEFKVEEGCIFVMGDHRNDSLDSRSNSVGQIDQRYIMGRVLLRLTPIERFGKVA